MSNQNQRCEAERSLPSLQLASTDRAGLLARIDAIVQAYHAGALGPTVHEVFPDIDKATVAWRVYFTLPCSINYQRKSETLWQSALRTFNDPETRFVFDPKNVVKGVGAYKQALSKHKLALQPNKHTYIWFTVSETFNKHFDGDPLNLFRTHEFDVASVKQYISARKSEFPYMSGPKLLNYWLYIFSSFTGVALKRKEEISVVPDIHVKRATVVLGLMTEEMTQDTNAVADLWSAFLKGTCSAPSDLHAPLWRWSRAGFPTEEHLNVLTLNYEQRGSQVSGST
jgi:hypothetical protein